ncbi:hypothetical protein Q4567_18615 [Aliiglaciecola sp. 2_MG-2023]|nr:hypothetical protein [Aliiglaciecola sp. 2_MG-2023]
MNARRISFILLIFSGLACLSFLIWPMMVILILHGVKGLTASDMGIAVFLTLFILTYPITVSIGFIMSLEGYRKAKIKNGLLGLSVSLGHLMIVFIFMYFKGGN